MILVWQPLEVRVVRGLICFWNLGCSSVGILSDGDTIRNLGCQYFQCEKLIHRLIPCTCPIMLSFYGRLIEVEQKTIVIASYRQLRKDCNICVFLDRTYLPLQRRHPSPSDC